MLVDVDRRQEIDDSILTFEGVEQLLGGVVVVDLVGFDFTWEFCRGGLPSQGCDREACLEESIDCWLPYIAAGLKLD